jgi:hypothetical protein
MADGTRFVAMPPATADALIKSFERRSFVEIQLEEGTVYLNPAHVAFVRNLPGGSEDSSSRA